jgi:hypothetical protein
MREDKASSFAAVQQLELLRAADSEWAIWGFTPPKRLVGRPGPLPATRGKKNSRVIFARDSGANSRSD